MNIYVLMDNEYSQVLELSTSKFNGFIEVALKENTIDLSKLCGYKMTLEKDIKYLEFDEEKYNNYIIEQNKDIALQEAQKKYDEISQAMVLKNATDEEAYTMRCLYNEWDKNGKSYLKDDRFMYEDKFYKVLQNHKSQEDWLPTTASGLYVEISDPNIEYPDFKQPQGSQDVYQTGDKITFEGKKYISLINDNVWSPTDYPSGWQLVEESEETE